ncbi:MAG: haloalkane dehalogenase [Cyanobacteria bacterium J06642_3]
MPDKKIYESFTKKFKKETEMISTKFKSIFSAMPVAIAMSLPLQGEAVSQDIEGSGVAISAEFPFERQFVEVNGSKMAYIEEGSGPVVLFIHGNATSSYLWRNVIPFVSNTHRTIALDLIGMGASDKPNIEYTFQDHYTYIEGFIKALNLQNVVLVLHDWGGGLGTYYATNNPENVRAVVMMETVTPPVMPIPSWEAVADPKVREAFQTFRDKTAGPQLILEQNFFIENFLPSSIIRPLSEVEMSAYRAPFPTPESRKPLLIWPKELPIAGEPKRNAAIMQKITDWLNTSEQPKLFLYASPGLIFTPDVVSFIPQVMNNVETRFIGAGLHYIQEDQPEAIGRNISDWLRDRLDEVN